ncbi:hypothetical protein RNJ44_02403 [Nakaseomyces bracarensis]|uniref:DUF788-domain-containing protein n=1 Tax=Nakaseomyces bracarensis TaxID=273131 RepID=A0ABR4NLQ9_9SACH
MAGKATKKQAAANSQTLGQLYKVTVPVLVLALLRTLLSSNKSYVKFVVFNLPLVVSLYVLEKTGRPQYDGQGRVVREGMDLGQAGGMTEYMFDLIYLSVIANVGRILFDTNKWWYLMLLCPVYVGYKLYSLKQQFFPSAATPAGQDTQSQEQTQTQKSKRQLKREKRGDDQVKYRYR